MTECFAVPFTEKTEEHYVAIVQDHHKLMYAFHRRNNRKEVIVGWYATASAKGTLLNDNSTLIHDFYKSECQNPVHIAVDTTLLGDTMQVRGFVRKELRVGNQVLANSFQELKTSVVLSEGEANCLALMTKHSKKSIANTWTAALPQASQRLQAAALSLTQVVQQLQRYVDGVVEGKIEGSREVGVQIAQALHAFTQQPLSAEQFAALQTRYQDLLMLAYLSTLTQTQTLVAEKLNQIL
jgi:translation initiation factor 3 subunit F